METSFWIWLIALIVIAGFGLSAMVSAYWGGGSVAVVFPEPIVEADFPVPTLNPEAAMQFQQGCEAYRARQYRRAVDGFTQAIRLDPGLAEAYHNRARATANLRRVTDAVAELVKASECYSQQDNAAGLEQVKQDLAVLKQQKP